MPYGRESIVESWLREDNDMYNLYLMQVMPADRLAELAERYYCNYVILERERQVDGVMEDYGMHLVGETDNYLVYRTAVPFW